MKCLKILRPMILQLTEEEEKTIILSNQVKIKVDRVSLCGSDLKRYIGNYSGPSRYPLVFGHEWSGEVLEIAKDETEIMVGDYVTGDCSRWCGICVNCTKDKNLCYNIEKFGITIDGYSQQIVIVDKRYLYISHNKVSHKVLALSECFSVALHMIHSLEIEKMNVKSKLLVIGCGPIGTATYILLNLLFKFRRVSVLERNPKRLEILKDIMDGYSVHIVEEQKNDFEAEEYSGVYSEGQYDYIFESSSSTDGLNTAISMANTLGRIAYIGLNDGIVLEKMMYITMKALTIRGSIGGTGEFEKVIEFLENNSDMVSKMVTLEVGLENAKEAFDKMISSQEHMKCQILF